MLLLLTICLMFALIIPDFLHHCLLVVVISLPKNWNKSMSVGEIIRFYSVYCKSERFFFQISTNILCNSFFDQIIKIKFINSWWFNAKFFTKCLKYISNLQSEIQSKFLIQFITVNLKNAMNNTIGRVR